MNKPSTTGTDPALGIAHLGYGLAEPVGGQASLSPYHRQKAPSTAPQPGAVGSSLAPDTPPAPSPTGSPVPRHAHHSRARHLGPEALSLPVREAAAPAGLSPLPHAGNTVPSGDPPPSVAPQGSPVHGAMGPQESSSNPSHTTPRFLHGHPLPLGDIRAEGDDGTDPLLSPALPPSPAPCAHPHPPQR